MPFRLNESEAPRKCAACGRTESLPIYADEAPDDLQFGIMGVIVREGKVESTAGYKTARAFQCRFCGHIDLYSWGVRPTEISR